VEGFLVGKIKFTIEKNVKVGFRQEENTKFSTLDRRLAVEN
jgi:hypothetical protein